ncbi:gypsy-16 si [Labeo rohita]|uniref:Gypsy-16 si n=1 Tax=Labeo rohita TaxID=84645 RepID=A0A498P3A6_LABRO|nr:gypsy-16 si [Labeo rohita]RXN39140.1 gypsy-16 si [Labeo rohita]
MAALSLPTPPMFFPCPGQPSVPIHTWKMMFENYLVAIDATGDRWPEERKCAVLLQCLGAEGLKVFYTLPNTGQTITDAFKTLGEHFQPATNVVVKRHKFRQRAQRPDESVKDYVVALRELSIHCNFGDHTDEMIRDQLVEKRIREHVLLQPQLTLTDAMLLAGRTETAVEHAQTLDAVSVHEIKPAQRGMPQRRRKFHEKSILQIPQIDWESSGLIPSDTSSAIQVPEIECPLSSEELNELKAAVDPVQPSENFGADVYIATLQCMHSIGYM